MEKDKNWWIITCNQMIKYRNYECKGIQWYEVIDDKINLGKNKN